MDSNIRNLKIAFNLAAPEDVISVLRDREKFYFKKNDRYINASGMSEAYYNMTFRKLQTAFSADEIRNMYYDMESLCEINDDIPKSLFQLLVNYGLDIFECRDGVPVVERKKLMDFRRISLDLGQDIFTTSYLAYMALRKKIPCQVKFDWNKVVSTNDRRLHNILSAGISENHFHLAGSAPVFFMSWIALMNNPNIIEKYFGDKSLFSENRNVTLSFSNDVRQLNWSSSLRYAAFLRVLLFYKVYGIHTDERLEFKLLNPDFSDVTTLSTIVLKSKTLYGEPFCQPDGTSKCLDYAIRKNNYFFDRSSANRMFCGERELMYRCFTACFDKTFDSKYSNMFYAYLLLKNRFRSELIQVNQEKGFYNFSVYQDRKSVFWGNIKEYWIEAQRMTVNSQFENGPVKSLEIRFSVSDTAEDIYKSICAEDNYIMFSDDSVIFRKKEFGIETDESSSFLDKENPWDRLDESKKASAGIKLPFFYVLHFIKTQHVRPDKYDFLGKVEPKNNDVRIRAQKSAIELAKALEHSEYLCSRIRGIDAASFEIACRPETFATEFRFLKSFVPEYYSVNLLTTKKRIMPKLGISYHVGEDFLDIADGLRAIDETIRFFGLSRGDRLGHALALGIAPDIHYASKGNTIIMPKQDMLDNFVWLLSRSNEFGIKIDVNLRDSMKRYCEQLLYEIYGKCMRSKGGNIHDYYNSWKLRGDHPDCYTHSEYDHADDEALFIRNSVEEKYRACLLNGKEYDHLRYNEYTANFIHYYHYGYHERIEGLKPCRWKVTFEYMKLISDVQKCMQELVALKGIAVECNLSSNQLIGTFGTYDRHPIFSFNMHMLSAKENKQHICVSINTDDQGVFDTSLENEYALLAECISGMRDENNNRIYNDEVMYGYIDYIRSMSNGQTFPD